MSASVRQCLHNLLQFSQTKFFLFHTFFDIGASSLVLHNGFQQMLVCVRSQSLQRDWSADTLCDCGATAGLWFPDLVRLTLQKRMEVRLHSTARHQASQLSLWCIHPTQRCYDTDGTHGSSHRWGKHHQLLLCILWLLVAFFCHLFSGFSSPSVSLSPDQE